MNKYVKLVFAATAVMAGTAAQAQTANTQNVNIQQGKAYVQDARGVVTTTSYGNCIRTGFWTPGDAFPGCDAPLEAPKVVAPAPAPAKAAPAPAPAPVAPAPTSEKVTFAADTFFDFDKAVLKADGKAKLDDMTSKLKDINLEVIIAVGHTDSIGSDKYNQKLSVKRAEAVKAYLVSKGIEANRVYTEGKGEKQPVADNKTAAGRAKNRRVEIEVVGTRSTKK
jgi:OmpA-OmpF porin, OOP family